LIFSNNSLAQLEWCVSEEKAAIHSHTTQYRTFTHLLSEDLNCIIMLEVSNNCCFEICQTSSNVEKSGRGRGGVEGRAADKGLGMFATRRIMPGELIIAEIPLFIVGSLNEVEAKVTELCKEKKEAYEKLYDCTSSTSTIGKYTTNALSLDAESSQGGLFATISRINHSCSCNANNAWNSRLQKMTIYAVKEIAAGEEILTSYLSSYRYLKRGSQDRLIFKKNLNFYVNVTVVH